MNDLLEGTFPAGKCVSGGEGHILPSQQWLIADAQPWPQIYIYLRSSEKGNSIFPANPYGWSFKIQLTIKSVKHK